MILNDVIVLIDNSPRKNNRIYNKDLKNLIKKLPKNTGLAIQLWDKNYKESRSIAIYIADPKTITEETLHYWVNDLDSWGLTDAFTCHLVKFIENNTTLAKLWISNENEFIRRAGFSTMAQLAWSKSNVTNNTFIDFLPLIIKHSNDDRLYVKKAINWLLRDIGKRNEQLLPYALKTIQDLKLINNKTSNWIATHRIKELTDNPINRQYYGK